MNKFINYLKDTYTELLHKVSWPSWNDLQGSSVVVLVASIIIALIIFAMDFSFDYLFKFIYEIF
ncbi:MAG: preprotein translocase subunit SecE [Bacteroidales bacterium]|jgi:preprotein translocase subunit SecE|nr:preprotein translocase subunit SecE [Bacteroidales bacterium]